MKDSTFYTLTGAAWFFTVAALVPVPPQAEPPARSYGYTPEQMAVRYAELTAREKPYRPAPPLPGEAGFGIVAAMGAPPQVNVTVQAQPYVFECRFYSLAVPSGWIEYSYRPCRGEPESWHGW